MIAKQDVYNVQTTVQGEQVAMGIDKSAMNHIMGIMSNMYSNKIRAMIREYSTNGLDAQIEAGVYDKPIEVELPSQLSQFLKVRDYGIGLDTQGIREIYSQYGASTKRASNDVVGMLGIGCKAALAYTSQFTVTSVKDGEKIVVAIARDASGAGTMTVQSRFDTDEDNGTVVTIPVAREDIYKFGIEASDFFSVWDPKNVSIDGQPPVHHGGLKVADGLYLLEQRGKSAVVMGNVAYPAPQLDDLSPGQSVIAYVPIGDVSFPPSREALQDDATTRDTIKRVRDKFAREIAGAVQREITAAESAEEAIQIMLRWDRVVPGSNKTDYTYGGHVIPRVIECGKYDPPVVEKDYYGNDVEVKRFFEITERVTYGRGHKPRSSTVVKIETALTSIFVANYDVKEFTAQHRRKASKWATDKGLSARVQYIVFCRQETPDCPFISPDHVVDWSEVKKIKLEPVKRVNGSTRIPGSYDLYTEETSGTYDYGRKGIPGADIRDDVPLYYLEGNLSRGKRYAAMLAVAKGKFTLVCLPGNRTAKFARDVTRAIEVTAEIPKLTKAWKDGLSEREKYALAMVDAGELHHFKTYSKLADKIKDPALRKPFLIAKLVDTDKLIEARNAYTSVNYTRGGMYTFDNPMDKYPLFDWRNIRQDADHAIIYVNAAYAAA